MNDNTEYWKAHEAVREIHGPASLQDCAFCGLDARDWAYNHKDPDEKVARFNGCAYSTDPAYYIPLCRSCHKRFDRRGGMVERFEDVEPVRRAPRSANVRARRPGLASVEPEDVTVFLLRILSRAFELGAINEELDEHIDKLALKFRRYGKKK